MTTLQGLSEKQRELLLDTVMKDFVIVPDLPGNNLILGLYNSDLNGCLYQLLSLHTAAFLDGVAGLTALLQTNRATLYLPEKAALDGDTLSRLGQSGMAFIDEAFIDTRREPGFYCHIADVLKIPDLLEGRDTDYSFLCVNGGLPEKISNSTPLGELLSAGTHSGWFEVGNTYVDASALQTSIGRLPITNGVVNSVPAENCVLHDTAQGLGRYREKSCGTCVFCREGLIQLDGMMRAVITAKGKPESLSLMREIGEAMRDSCSCTLGGEAALAVLSTLQYGEDSYRKHIERKKCPQGVCIKSGAVYVDPFACTGCGACVSSCPHDCMDGKEGYIHLLYDVDCTKCESCIPVCPQGAIRKTEGRPPRLPDRLVKAGMYRY